MIQTITMGATVSLVPRVSPITGILSPVGPRPVAKNEYDRLLRDVGHRLELLSASHA